MTDPKPSTLCLRQGYQCKCDQCQVWIDRWDKDLTTFATIDFMMRNGKSLFHIWEFLRASNPDILCSHHMTIEKDYIEFKSHSQPSQPTTTDAGSHTSDTSETFTDLQNPWLLASSPGPLLLSLFFVIVGMPFFKINSEVPLDWDYDDPEIFIIIVSVSATPCGFSTFVFTNCDKQSNLVHAFSTRGRFAISTSTHFNVRVETGISHIDSDMVVLSLEALKAYRTKPRTSIHSILGALTTSSNQ